MKICYICGTCGLASETFSRDLACGLNAHFEEFVALSDRTIDRPNGPVVPVETRFISKAFSATKWQSRFSRIIGRPDSNALFSARIRQATKSLAPYLEDTRPDAAIIDFANVAIYARMALEKPGIPYIIHVHGSDITSARRDPGYEEQLKQTLDRAAAIVAASNHIRRLLVLLGAPREKIHVVRLGVSLQGVTPLPWDQRRKKPPTIMFLGRLTPKKNPVALVEAFAIALADVPAARLIIIGDGPEMGRVKDRIQSLGIGEKVELTGELPQRESLEKLNRARVYAQHSVTAHTGDQEGFGISLAEAAALGLPVVSTQHNGIPEQVIDGETGYLVPEHDFESMGTRIAELLNNPEQCEKMGTAGNEHIREMCITEKRIADVAHLLEQSVGQKTGA